MGGHVAKISTMEIFIIMIMVNGLVNHVIINPIILGASGRDSWLVPLVSFFGLILWSWLLYTVMKRSGQQRLQPWLAQKTGKIVSWLLMLPVIIQIFVIGASTCLHTASWTATNYLPNTPRWAVVIILLAVSGYCAVAGIRAIAIGAGALLPFVVVLGYFVSISNTRHKDFKMLTPILEKGFDPLWDGVVFAIGCYMELVLFLLLQHHLKKGIKLWQFCILAAILTHIMLGPIIGAITEFGPYEAAKQTESPFEQWRLVKIGDYIEHVDFFSVFQWMSGATIRIALSLFLLADLLPSKTKKSRKWMIWITSVVFMVITLMPISRELFHSVMKSFYVLNLYVVGTITLIWLCISYIGKTEKERSL
jgi:spore germination protein (amino acid permease)